MMDRESTIRRSGWLRWAPPVLKVIKAINMATQTRGAKVSLVVVVSVILIAVAADVIAPYDPLIQDYTALLQAPSLSHPFGTDHVGRDILSRVIHGTRTSIAAGMLSVGFAILVGGTAGLVAGYLRNWIAALIMRIADAIFAFPSLLLALVMASVLGPSLQNIMIAVGVVFSPTIARLVRAESLSVRERDFVTAAVSSGAAPTRITLVHILPNVMATVIVMATLLVSAAILIEAGLSFLGVGLPPPAASWGADLRDGARYLRVAWWASFFPGCAIFLTVLAINLLGDGLRISLDPRQRRTLRV
jgi:peptide/nickel transport system permease protein